MTARHTYEEKGTYQLSLLVTDPHGASNRAVATVEVKPSVPWIEVFFIVVVFIAVAVITWHYIHKQPKRKFPEPEVNIDVKSGVEYPAGLEGENRELPDISVEVRSGIWKEGEKR
jgi:PKD repeat protein